MPFIYHGLFDDEPGQSDVLAGFVDADVSFLSPFDNERISISHNGIVEWLRRKRRIVLLGQAGAGKTTFLRYMTLSVAAELPTEPFYFGTDLIPVFVPLKAVDEKKDLPILHYILENVGYFRGSWGRLQLRKAARRKKILLVLDGYDEIPSTVEHKVRVELSRLFSYNKVPLLAFISDSKYNLAEKDDLRIIDLLRRHNRIWLTSREEFFFAHNPTPATARGGSRVTDLDSVAALLRVEGVATHREQLVQKIFNRYDNRELLNVDRFLRFVDEMEEVEDRHLSHNPLALTIMCYVYAKDALEAKPGNAVSFGTFDEMIERCIRLLVRDLDKEKARELPEKRRALLEAQNDYPEEKEGFLRFFAGSLYVDQVSLFDVDYLRRKAKEFFSTSNSLARTQILQGLDRAMAAESDDIITQLIYAGIFIRQMISPLGALYDFPHRRIREVLAWRFYDHNPTYLYQNVGNVSWYELILFVFSRGTHSATLFDLLLSLVVSEPDSAGRGRLAERCFASISGRAHQELRQTLLMSLDRFFEHRLADGCPFRLPMRFAHYIAEDPSWVSLMTNRLRSRLAGGPLDLRFLCEIVSIVSLNEFKAELERYWGISAPISSEEETAVLLKYTLRIVPSAMLAGIHRIRGDAKAIDWMAFCFVRYCSVKDSSFLVELLGRLETEGVSVFLLRIEREDFDSVYKKTVAVLEQVNSVLAAKHRRRMRSATAPSREAQALADLSVSPFLRELFESGPETS